MNKLLIKFQAERIKVLLLIGIFFILMPATIALRLIPFEWRFVLLTAITLVLFFLRPTKQTQNTDLGIKRQNTVKSVVEIIPVTVLLAIPIMVIAVVSEPRYDNSGLTVLFYVFYVLLSCPFQEFAYRGYLFHALDILQVRKWQRIAVAAILYSFVHIIYDDPYILLSTFIAGFLWNIYYDVQRNLVGVTFSHAVLGLLTIALGLI